MKDFQHSYICVSEGLEIFSQWGRTRQIVCVQISFGIGTSSLKVEKYKIATFLKQLKLEKLNSQKEAFFFLQVQVHVTGGHSVSFQIMC